ncbi:MAG: amino acid ABC transporter substrate-binding protein [Clostridiales bacterium]|nr:amino acid ABC transporter substrate-binding protein [Clostridiales bacterium]
MKKILSILLFVSMLVVSGFAMAQEDNSLTAIKEKSTFVLGFDPGFPPMGYRDDTGAYVGFDLDVAKEVAKQLEVELILQPIDWAAKEMELSSGNIDCIWNGMTVTPDREEAMSLSLPYLENAQVICVLADSPYTALTDFAGKTISLQAGSSAEDALDASGDFKDNLTEAVKFENNVAALLDLDNGNCDGVLIDIIVANYYIAQKGANYRVLDEALAPEQYAIGFRKDDIALTDAVNDILLAMAKEGSLAEISTTWFSEDITIIDQ